ncbi:glycosyltransferase [Candidatus Bathyarchaeota archaeon]|nr:glycosyltransferase [Candidatus Bathyarchaeota archaeon]
MEEKEIIYFFLDPLENLYGPLTPPFLLGKELKGLFDPIFVSQMITEDVKKTLKIQNFEMLNLKKRFYSSGSLLTMEAWLRKSKYKRKSDADLAINFSQCFLADVDIYYGQGPITQALDDMYPEQKKIHQFVYWFSRRFLVNRDKAFTRNLKSKSRLFIANSKFCASMYQKWGIKVDQVIYPPLDCQRFKSKTSNPSNDYVCTYIGKETKYSILNKIASTGVKIKAFGSKSKDIPKQIQKNKNIELLGKVTDKDLVGLFSNALFTLFTFTHEPFGYIPVESMACGTPVMTYNKQGPGESIIHNKTGWLVNNDAELEEQTLKIWKKGYSPKIRNNCLERALDFDQKIIGEKWVKVLNLLEKDSTIGSIHNSHEYVTH